MPGRVLVPPEFPRQLSNGRSQKTRTKVPLSKHNPFASPRAGEFGNSTLFPCLRMGRENSERLADCQEPAGCTLKRTIISQPERSQHQTMASCSAGSRRAVIDSDDLCRMSYLIGNTGAEQRGLVSSSSSSWELCAGSEVKTF
ncbi:TRAP-type transport system periplasmic protein 2 [Anopheles sinensis]|uniref:TRAP-type transport system periplasmic protein 2 n=1 Tax=Anopheles sinensis TaxID=74873 RepID=A0A084VLK1_ANOSI|nr:TRAP-type transport system periplasmic protein 2 [Anopheles sinensis]